MELKVMTWGEAAPGATMTVPDTVFGAAFNEPLIHQVVTACMAGARAGTKAQLSRGQVRASNIKPWRQKGTGRARAGSRASPIWRGGGVTFAAVPRDYSQKVNRRMFGSALRSILSELVRQDRLIVVDRFAIEQPKTKLLSAAVRKLGAEHALLVTEGVEPQVELAARNLPWVAVSTAAAVDPVSLVRFDKVIVTQGALRKLEERLA
ncbi:MAG: 50S ribosomal protein L4 [Gammaproteobacteria bacterium]